VEPRFRFRLYLLTALVLVGSGVLLSRLYRFQIEDREFYRRRVPGTRTVAIREPGVRGTIVDRQGVVLAENIRNYELVFNLEEIHLEWKRQTAPRRIGGGEAPMGSSVPTTAASREIIDIVRKSIVPRLARHGIQCRYSSTALQAHYVTHGGLVPFRFPVDLTYDQFARLAEHNLEMAGVYVTVRPRRHYPYGTLACHILGYLKQWEKGDIPAEAKAEFDHYLGDDRGEAGIEATMNDHLIGPPGKRTLLKDEKGRILGLVDYVRPGQGCRVELAIDARAQYLVENVLRRAGRAAAVVMDPNSGEVLAMASVPDYDPNQFIPSIDAGKWREYIQNRADPLVNRAISSFAPGSTFKLPTAVAACLYDRTSFHHSCVGYLTFGRSGDLKIRCWKRGGHGYLDFEEAIQRSCNPFFMKLATEIGVSKMVEACELLNLGAVTGVRLPAEDKGIVPGSRWWRREYRPGAAMTQSLLAQLAIGQGDSEATPLQMAALAGCIANGGKYYRPRVVRRVVHPERGVVVSDLPDLRVNLLEKGVTTREINTVRHGMWLAANEWGGTARRASLEDVAVAAKTGTAQTADLGVKSHNAWTVAFAPYEAPRYAVAVVVQNGKSGGRVAGPLVHLILRGLFAAENGLKLPLAKMREFDGHFDPIEEIDLPDEDLLSLAIDEGGETGEEAAEAQPDAPPVQVQPRAIPLPSITPNADSGTPPTSEERPPPQ